MLITGTHEATYREQPILENRPPQLQLLIHARNLPPILRICVCILDKRRNRLRVGRDERRVPRDGLVLDGGGSGGGHGCRVGRGRSKVVLSCVLIFIPSRMATGILRRCPTRDSSAVVE